MHDPSPRMSGFLTISQRSIRLTVELNVRFANENIIQKLWTFLGEDARRLRQGRAGPGVKNILDQQFSAIAWPAMDDSSLRPERIRFVNVGGTGEKDDFSIRVLRELNGCCNTSNARANN